MNVNVFLDEIEPAGGDVGSNEGGDVGGNEGVNDKSGCRAGIGASNGSDVGFEEWTAKGWLLGLAVEKGNHGWLKGWSDGRDEIFVDGWAVWRTDG